jgi:hypothetical protein
MSRPKQPTPKANDKIEVTLTAVVCSDGRILPIVESLGRRVLREIDPGSREGQMLLKAGKVQLWTDSGRRFSRLPVEVVLREDNPCPGGAALRRAEVRRWRSLLAEATPGSGARGKAPRRRTRG